MEYAIHHFNDKVEPNKSLKHLILRKKALKRSSRKIKISFIKDMKTRRRDNCLSSWKRAEEVKFKRLV